MENEYQVLNHLQENEITTQRKISSNTGLSLGAVNLLLKKMTRKGLVKVEKLNARSVRYVLTPKGLQEKARLTYSFIRLSYQRILKINHALDELLKEHAAWMDGKPIVLYGPADEIREILTQHLSERSIPYNLLNENDLSKQTTKSNNQKQILTWREEEEAALSGHSAAINIMKLL